MARQRVVFNVSTGQTDIVDLTQAEITAMDAEAAAQIAAEAARLAALPQYGGDDAPLDQIAAGVTQLRAYLALPSPTAVQSAAALKLLIRVALFVLRRLI